MLMKAVGKVVRVLWSMPHAAACYFRLSKCQTGPSQAPDRGHETKIVEYRDVRHKRTGVVKHRVPEVIGVRRIPHAHLIGMQEDFTAVVYEGSGFERASHIPSLLSFSHRMPSAPCACGTA
jgi:hypothetical protein